MKHIDYILLLVYNRFKTLERRKGVLKMSLDEFDSFSLLPADFREFWAIYSKLSPENKEIVSQMIDDMLARRRAEKTKLEKERLEKEKLKNDYYDIGGDL